MTSGKIVGIHHIGVTVSGATATLDTWESLLDCNGKALNSSREERRIYMNDFYIRHGINLERGRFEGGEADV